VKFVEEVVVDQFLPTVRSMLAEELRERGFTQHEVADALGVSQSAVSKYAHGDVSQTRAVLDDERVRATVEEVAAGLAAGEKSRVAALIDLEVLIRELEDGDLLADLHEDAMPELADTEYDFAVHDPDSEARVRERTLSSVRRGLRAIRNSSGFAALLPNVGANLVEALPDATTVDDVAAVPGRIFDVKGRASVPADPEFGVSGHVAGVLLAARDAGIDGRAALNVGYTPDAVESLRAAGYQTVEFDAEGGPEAVGAALREEAPDATDSETVVVYQSGGYGIEPIVYILGPDAPAVVRTARETL
jgi:predicted fused transcriptional regulator/phosphomethylpyrimidine kinase/predicted transcriptional regulator